MCNWGVPQTAERIAESLKVVVHVLIQLHALSLHFLLECIFERT